MLKNFILNEKNDLVSGFSITLSPYPEEEFTGWPEVTYVFGNIEEGTTETLTFSQDLQEIQICTETDDNEPTTQNLKGFRFLEYGTSQYLELNLPCSGEWIVHDLVHKRLIGFKTLSSSDDSIKTIQPIVDCPDCTSIIAFNMPSTAPL